MISRDQSIWRIGDSLHRRVQRKLYVGGQLDRTFDDYFNAEWQLLEVRRDGDGDPYTQYVWGVNYIDAPVVRWRDVDTDGDVDETLYYTWDANQNVIALVDADGDAVERYDYAPYGQVAVFDEDWSSRGASAYDNAILFAGYRHDAESGLYHVRNRMLHPKPHAWDKAQPAPVRLPKSHLLNPNSHSPPPQTPAPSPDTPRAHISAQKQNKIVRPTLCPIIT